jgi:hypothetical protein
MQKNYSDRLFQKINSYFEKHFHSINLSICICCSIKMDINILVLKARVCISLYRILVFEVTFTYNF